MAPHHTSLSTSRSQRRQHGSSTMVHTSSAPPTPPPLAPTYMDNYPPDILNAPLMRTIPLPSDVECDTAQYHAFLVNQAPYGAFAQNPYVPGQQVNTLPPSGPVANGQPYLYMHGYSPEELYNFQRGGPFNGSSYFAFIPIGAAPSSAVPIDQMASSYNNSQSQTTSGPTNASPTKQAQNISQSLFPSKSPVTPAPSPMPATSPQTVGVSSPPRRNNEVRVRHDPAHRHSARPET